METKLKVYFSNNAPFDERLQISSSTCSQISLVYCVIWETRYAKERGRANLFKRQVEVELPNLVQGIFKLKSSKTMNQNHRFSEKNIWGAYYKGVLKPKNRNKLA